MIELQDIRYCRLGTRDLAAAEWFAINVLGLEVADRAANAVYFRSDQRDHTLCYFEGNPADQTTAFEVSTATELEAAAAELEAKGHDVRFGGESECALRKVKAFIAFADPSGNRIEFVLRPATTGRRLHGARDAGITGFSHVGFYSSDPRRDEQFWTGVCNARVSDRLGEAPLLRIHAVHHAIAIVPRAAPGIQHINHQVASTDDVQRSHALLQRMNVPIVFGPGRHPASSAQFLYFIGPDGVTFEYSTGVMEIADEPLYRERQFSPDAKGMCEWGAQPASASLKIAD